MYETGNPVPSSALEDMADNAQTFDALVTKTEGTTTDRFGVTRRVFQQILMDMGFQPLAGSFQTGATITARSQTLYDEVSHVFYAWGGTIPVGGYIVPAGSTPATSGGTGIGAWADKTDLMLRSDINIVQKRFACVADAIADTSLTTGRIVETLSYLSGWAATALGPKGGNRYEVVAAGTGTPDGGRFINTANGLQLKALFPQGKSFYHFGAKGTGTDDDSIAIQAAITSGGSLNVEDGTYSHSSQINLVSNLKLKFKPNAVIKPSNAIALYAWFGNAVSNVRIIDGNFEHTGDAYTDSNQRIIQFNSSSKISLIRTELSKSRSDGAVFDACTDVTIDNGSYHNNYQTGITFRNGCSKLKVNKADFYGNGNTGTASPVNGVGGRGLLFWQCSNMTVFGGSVYDNTEYGVRFYSQAGDTEGNRAGTMVGTQLRNNGTATGIDLYVYDEGGLTERLTFSDLIFSTKASATAAAISGKGVAIKGCSGAAITQYSSNTAFNLYGATDCIVEGNIMRGYQSGVSLSDSAGHVTTKCKVTGNIFDGVAAPLNGIIGVDNEITGNTFTHGGAGITDVGVGVTKTGVTGKLHDNIFDGFYRGINLAALTPNISIKRNKTKNSTGSGIFAQYQGTLVGLAFSDNDFDSAYPEIYATLQKQSNSSYDRATVLCATQPGSSVTTGAGITWSIGDRGIRSNPAVGAIKSWVCTVAGSPGTWVSEGVL